MKTKFFKCPSCGSSHFGTTFPDAPKSPDGRVTQEMLPHLGTPRWHCHDEFNRGCTWTGRVDSECMVEVEIGEYVPQGGVGDAQDF